MHYWLRKSAIIVSVRGHPFKMGKCIKERQNSSNAHLPFGVACLRHSGHAGAMPQAPVQQRRVAGQLRGSLLAASLRAPAGRVPDAPLGGAVHGAEAVLVQPRRQGVGCVARQRTPVACSEQVSSTYIA